MGECVRCPMSVSIDPDRKRRGERGPEIVAHDGVQPLTSVYGAWARVP
jgi:hypothetical protein